LLDRVKGIVIKGSAGAGMQRKGDSIQRMDVGSREPCLEEKVVGLSLKG
jgi:hypothetical protein